MSGKRPVKDGSFGGHFDELVKHFPHDRPRARASSKEEDRILREKRDIHAQLFEQAWKLERPGDGKPGS